MFFVLFTACSSSYSAQDAAENALISDENVTIEIDDWISFYPAESSTELGFIFYPGGKVEAESYAPVLRRIAEQGIQAHIAILPLDLALLDQDAAAEIMEAEDPELWILGGHSLGGVGAANLASKDANVVGLSLWASYPASSVDLSGWEYPVQSITGSNDAILNLENYEEAKERLPSSTDWIDIDGGNHSQFGDYGFQDGDGEAAITPEEQWTIIAQETSTMIFSIYPEED